MPSDWFEQLGGTEHKSEIVKRHLARLNTSSPPESPAIAARKKQEAAEKLIAHDALFGVWPGCTLGAPPPKLERPRFEAGDDPAGRDD